MTMSTAAGPFQREMHLVHPPRDARSDQSLITAANDGDADAFDALYRRHRDWIVSLALRYTSDPDESLDVLQDVWVYFLGKFPGFQLTAQLTTFFYPAVKHVALARQRKRRRIAAADDATLTAQPDTQPGPDAGDLGDLASLLTELPDIHREVVLLRFVDDMSLQEIAAALDVPVGTVKSRLHHAVRTLRADPRMQRYFEDSQRGD